MDNILSGLQQQSQAQQSQQQQSQQPQGSGQGQGGAASPSSSSSSSSAPPSPPVPEQRRASPPRPPLKGRELTPSSRPLPTPKVRTSLEEQTVHALKSGLLEGLYGTARGVTASQEQRAQAEEYISALEAHNPYSSPTDVGCGPRVGWLSWGHPHV